MESYIIIIIHYTCMKIHCSTVKSRQLTVPLFCTDAVESDIRSAFAEHGTVQKVQMPLDRNTVSDCWKNMLLHYIICVLLHTFHLYTFRIINFNGRGALVDLHLSPCLMPMNMSLPLKQ